MPLGTNPPDLNVHAGDLTLVDVAELNAIATQALHNGAGPDMCIKDLSDEDPEPEDEDDKGDYDRI